MRRAYKSRKLPASNEEIAARAVGVPIPDGSGRIVRNGVIVSAADNARAVATRARNAAFDRQTGEYADRSGTINPDAEGRAAGSAAYRAAFSGGDSGDGGVRRAYAGDDGSVTTDTAMALRRAYRDLSSIRADNRRQKIELAKRAGTFSMIRDDWNARNEKKGKFMDENGDIHDTSIPATDDAASSGRSTNTPITDEDLDNATKGDFSRRRGRM